MRVDKYRVLERCISQGLAFGWSRAHKHTDKPTKEFLLDALEGSIMEEVSEYFTFRSYDDEDRFEASEDEVEEN